MEKDYLVELYDKYGSIGKVASHLSMNYATVRYWYNKHCIEVQPSCMTVFQEIRNTPMSKEQKSIVLGSVLGDGCLKLAPHCVNARLTVGHCAEQLEYLKWKYNRLAPFSRKLRLDQKAKDKVINRYPCRSTDFYSFFTIAHPDITDFYNRYYRNRKKVVISDDIIEELDLVALAVWFCDDGSVCVDKRNNVPTCSIATNSFSYNEQIILVKALRRFFSGTIKIDVQGNVGREDFYIRMYKTKDIKQFLSMISFVLPECIHYKLHLQRLGVKPLQVV